MIAYYIIGTIATTLVIVASFLSGAKWVVGRIDKLEERVISQGERLAEIEGQLSSKPARVRRT